jgi:hypothetical protein
MGGLSGHCLAAHIAGYGRCLIAFGVALLSYCEILVSVIGCVCL